MTIDNDELHGVYYWAKAGRFDPIVESIAQATKVASDGIRNAFGWHYVRFPCDDRMVKIELDIFKTALEYNGYDYRNLKDMEGVDT